MEQPSTVASLTPASLLAHERLEAYQVSVEVDELVVLLCRRVPRGNGWLVDQIQRASGSTILNLVEANGRLGADRTQLLRVAKGSALEVDAALGLLQRRSFVSPKERGEAHEKIFSLVRLIAGLMRVPSR